MSLLENNFFLVLLRIKFFRICWAFLQNFLCRNPLAKLAKQSKNRRKAWNNNFRWVSFFCVYQLNRKENFADISWSKLQNVRLGNPLWKIRVTKTKSCRKSFLGIIFCCCRIMFRLRITIRIFIFELIVIKIWFEITYTDWIFIF